MSSEMSLDLTFSHKGVAHRLSLPPSTTLADLQSQLEELISVPSTHQKLLYKGKKTVNGDATIIEAGLRDGMKVQLLGSTAQEVSGLRAVEDEHSRIERIKRERAAKPPVKVRSTGSASSSSDSKYKFHRIEPLSHLPNPASARTLLSRLSEDPAIRHIMRTHQFTVGVLTELAPHEQPHLLGENVNAGQVIKLRLRTDAYDGFRPYLDVRKVLCHELTHNVWGDHDNNFKELNSKLNREVTDFERAAAAGTHHFSGDGYTYQPSSELETEAHTYILGGGSQVLGGSSLGLAADESREERRRRVLEATMNRLRQEEAELEQSCGTLQPGSHT